MANMMKTKMENCCNTTPAVQMCNAILTVLVAWEVVSLTRELNGGCPCRRLRPYSIIESHSRYVHNVGASQDDCDSSRRDSRQLTIRHAIVDKPTQYDEVICIHLQGRDDNQNEFSFVYGVQVGCLNHRN